MKETKTAVCGICQRESALTKKEIYQSYTLWECLFCGGQFWDPLKNPGSEWYEKDDRYASRNQNPRERQERNHREFLLDHPLSGEKILDIGMGTGNFLRAAKTAGYDCYGIDFDRAAILAAQSQFGLTNVYGLSIAEAREKFGSGFFGVVTMFEVLEHLENPEEALRLAHDLLKAKGVVALSIPHRFCPAYLKPHDLPPRHLTRWNESAIKAVLNRAGFSVLRLRSLPISLGYIITKFHFLTMGVASFNLTQKLTSNSTIIKKTPTQKALLKIIPIVARLKDYILFSLPALLLWVYAILRGYRLGLYVLAERKD